MRTKQVQTAVGQRIRSLRRARGWTIERLAATGGMATSFLSNVERGVQNPSLVILARIANALDRDLAAIVDVVDGDAEKVRARLAKRVARLDASELRVVARWFAKLDELRSAPRERQTRTR